MPRATAAYWDRWYERAEKPIPMGRNASYRMAVDWLDLEGCTLEDWGGGTGYARRFVQHATYRLVDGSPSQWNPDPVELTEYASNSECILIRHVLEHNDDWARILANAAGSFRRRMTLVLYTPIQEVTRPVSKPHARVVEYGFALDDIERMGGPWLLQATCGPETLLFYERA